MKNASLLFVAELKQNEPSLVAGTPLECETLWWRRDNEQTKRYWIF